MRHLALFASLALVVACGDTTSPTSSAAPTAESAAHLGSDLRDVRASLIAAGNEVSAAMAEHGVANGLGGAFASNGILLAPRKPAIRGRDEVTAFLAGDPLAPSALSWEVIFAEVSTDASQGFTWSQGSSTLDAILGPTPNPSFFLTYWRRTDGGRWKIAAFVLNLGGPQPLPLPDGFGTPTRRAGRTFPPADVKDLRRQLLAADAAFAAYSVEHGSGPAFERYAAPRAIAASGTFVFGPEAIGEAFTGGPNDVVDWAPRFVDAAGSGDLGFTVGDASFNLEGIPPFYTKYLSVWQRQQSGRWKFIADLGNSRPAPTP